MPSWRSTPLPRDWRKRRRRVLERDGYRCQIRGPDCIGTATEVDHIVPGDDHREENLQSACGPCHRTKTGKANAARWPKRTRPPEPHPGLIAEGWEGPPRAPRRHRRA